MASRLHAKDVLRVLVSRGRIFILSPAWPLPSSRAGHLTLQLQRRLHVTMTVTVTRPGPHSPGARTLEGKKERKSIHTSFPASCTRGQTEKTVFAPRTVMDGGAPAPHT